MTRKRLFIFIALLLGLCAAPAAARAQTPEVSAQAAIVMEQSTGRVLFEKNPDLSLPMASTTKIMTAILALEQGDPAAVSEISSTAAGTEGSSMYLEPGEKMTLRELLYGLMLASGNDAAVAIAEQLGGLPAFVDAMNRRAAELGASNTHFTNPNGLPDPDHRSTARDMALLAARGLEIPEFAEIVSTQTYSIAGEGKAYPRTLTNHNKLLRLCPGCIGVKTGFTKAAGRCLVSAAHRDSMTLVCVTLNAPDDWNDHMNLYDSLFADYALRPVVQAETPLENVPVTGSETLSLAVGAETEFLYPLTQEETCVTRVTLSGPLEAPVEPGTPCGVVSVQFQDRELAALPLVTREGAAKLPVMQTLGQDLLENLEKIYRRWLTLFP